MWHHVDQGQGRPLVLLHGIGMSSRAWHPVLPPLARTRRVIAFDVAGFGQSPMLPSHVPPTTANLVLALREVLEGLGLRDPVDIAGNSMGGWMALEAARLGLARSVVAISPAGLWTRPPPHVKPLFFGMRRFARMAPGLARAAMRAAPLRGLLMAVPIGAGSWRMPADEAVAATMDFAGSTGFEATLASADRFVDGHGIRVPVTVAFGTRDWLLTPAARLRGELPPHARWLKPRGWGHVPMWQDPQGVARLILDGTG